MGRLKKPSALPFAALHHPLWDYGIVFALQRDTAIAPGGGRSFYSCIFPNGWPIWRRKLQSCLYLVGPPEDSLGRRLRISLVLGRTRPCSGGDCVPCCPPFGQFLHKRRSGHHHLLLEWGSPLSSNTRSSWAEPDINHLYMNKRRAWIWGGPR